MARMQEAGADGNIQFMLMNVIVQSGLAGVQRRYDVLFTDIGMALPVVASSLKMAAAGLAGGFGTIEGPSRPPRSTAPRSEICSWGSASSRS